MASISGLRKSEQLGVTHDGQDLNLRVFSIVEDVLQLQDHDFSEVKEIGVAPCTSSTMLDGIHSAQRDPEQERLALAFLGSKSSRLNIMVEHLGLREYF